jgi:hypothetical protein
LKSRTGELHKYLKKKPSKRRWRLKCFTEHEIEIIMKK